MCITDSIINRKLAGNGGKASKERSTRLQNNVLVYVYGRHKKKILVGKRKEGG